ncbi:Ig-like domain-containing protein, partial [Enterobacteriaceae bacterium H20N1]
NAAYISGGTMQITVMLKDAAGNAVSGAASALTAETVTVANAEQKDGSWKDNGDGTYNAAYTATVAGTGLKAALKLNGWKDQSESAAYVIKAIVVKGFNVNGYSFKKDDGFPSTGFKGAKFSLELENGSASDFAWTSDTSWVSVGNGGVVTFTENGNSDKVTIIGTPKNGSGEKITWSFSLKFWYINNGETLLNWSDADAYCRGNADYKLPSVEQLSLSYRGPNALWSEWGDMSYYDGAGFAHANYWASELHDTGSHIIAGLGQGTHSWVMDSTPLHVTCIRAL